MIRLRAAEDGVDQRRGRRTKIKRGESSAVAGLQQCLEFRRGEKQLVRAVGVVVEHFDARSKRAGSEVVGDGFSANEIAPGVSAKVRRVNAAEDAVPVSVIALRAQEEIARLRQLLGLFLALIAGRSRSGSNARRNAQHFFVQQVGFRILSKKAAPGTAAEKGQHFGA